VRYARRDGVLWRHSSDAVILLAPSGGGQVFTLEGSGVDLWQLLSEPIALEDAADALAEAYGTTAADVAADIAPVLDELSRREVVEVRDE
jgi:hypothetical protein